MSAGQKIPPWLQEEVARMQQTQQNLQSVMAQKQQVEVDQAEVAKAIEELAKAGEGDAVYRRAGSILVQSDKKTLTADLEERKVLGSTRQAVLAKQEDRLRASLKEQDEKIGQMIKDNAPAAPGKA